MKNLFFFVPSFLIIQHNFAQTFDASISFKEVERIEKTLSSDDMQGRGLFTVGIEKAADFIGSEFKAAGLKTWNNNETYRQPFLIIKTKLTDVSGVLDGQEINQKNIFVISSQTDQTVDQGNGYEKKLIKKGDNLTAEAGKYIQSNKNFLVLVDSSFSDQFWRLSTLKSPQFKSAQNIIFILTAANPDQYNIHFQQQITEQKLANVLGVLPGKTKRNEYVIFSGHYDHLGIGAANEAHDSIYNGANDDASGITAVIMLAKYFSKLKQNDRTLLFVAFTAEESGGYGSNYFSHQFSPDEVVAMFNIEMIGTESKWGLRSGYITGYEKSDLGKIMKKNLGRSSFRFYPDPYPDQDLFYRSDNAGLAAQGVPAHTISTSKMDSDKYYHKLGDEVETLDIKNMTEIIKAIAMGSMSIVEGKDSPTRINKN